MAQSWHDLLFAHWPVPLEQLRRVVPAPLEIDTFGGQPWMGIVAFRISQLHLRGCPPLPWLDGFPEVNLRTYVTYGGLPGVLFLSLHCPARLAMALARPWFRLPYRYASVSLAGQSDSSFTCRSPAGARFSATYRACGSPCSAPDGSLIAWLTERYRYYSPAADGSLFRGDIAHPRWSLAPATTNITENTLAAAFGIQLADEPPLVHYAEHMQAHIWRVRHARPRLTR
jgi:uncharacterized protein YqjF (DUF2071 family)